MGNELDHRPDSRKTVAVAEALCPRCLLRSFTITDLPRSATRGHSTQMVVATNRHAPEEPSDTDGLQ
jgi:hypothetical protein